MALFLDAGQVAANRRDFELAEFDIAWGIGARFHGPHFNALRLEVGARPRRAPDHLRRIAAILMMNTRLGA